MNKSLMIFAIAIMLIGCFATVPLATLDADEESKKFSPPANKSYIYILRDNWGAPHLVEVNGERIGLLSNETYFLLKVQPAEYKIKVGLELAYEFEAKGEDSGMLGFTTAYVDILAEPGHMYFLRIETPATKGGPSAILTMLHIGKGKEYILNYKRALDQFEK